jgi:hypothetical protein
MIALFLHVLVDGLGSAIVIKSTLSKKKYQKKAYTETIY